MPPIEHILDTLYYSILPEFAIAFLVLAIIAWRDEKYAPGGAAIGLIFAVALGPTIGHWLHDFVKSFGDGPASEYVFWLTGVLKPMPNESTWNRLPWTALAALCVGRLTRDVSADAWLVRGATSFAIAWWVMPEHALAIGTWVVPAFAAIILLNWMLLECLASKSNDGSVALCVFLCFFVASLVLIQAAFASLGEPAIMFGSAFLGLAVVAWWRGVDVSGAMPAAAVMLPGMLLIGQQESTVETLPLLGYVCAAVAPLVLVLALPFAHWHWLWRHLLRLALIAIPLGLAVKFAMDAGPLDFGA